MEAYQHILVFILVAGTGSSWVELVVGMAYLAADTAYLDPSLEVAFDPMRKGPLGSH